jgi:hypothetical protein
MSDVLNRASQLLTPKKSEVFFYGFLPKISKEYFDDGPGVDKDEKLKPSNADKYVITGSIDTAAIDAFRQGVEITRIKHFFAGSSPRIHAGEPGHVLRKNFYGADRNFLKENYYKELEYYNPVEYLLSHEIITYPLITHDTDETENYNFNGVIEPLTIRAVAALYSIDVPFEAHSLKGMMMDGNVDITMSNSRILTVDDRKTKDKMPPWMDLVDMIGTVKKIPTMMFFNDDKTYLNPFNDATTKVQLSTNLPNDMIGAVLKMVGSTENYISENQVSATCGWTYGDTSSKGTDSLAFGGFAY